MNEELYDFIFSLDIRRTGMLFKVKNPALWRQEAISAVFMVI